MTARPPAPVFAPPGRRVGAYAIDALVAAAIGIATAALTLGAVLGFGTPGDAATLALAFALAAAAAWVALLAWSLVCTAMQGGQGSVGQRALGLRLLDAHAPVAIGFWRALWRNVVWAASCAIVVGWFTPLFDASPRRQGWHDRAAGALVLDVRRADAAAVAATVRASSAQRSAPRAARRSAPRSAPAAPQPQPWFLDAPSAPRVPAPALVPAHPARPAVSAAVAASAPTMTAAVVHGSVAVAEASAPSVPVMSPTPATRPVTLPALDDVRSVTVPPPAQRAALFDDAPVVAVLTWDDGTRMAVYGRTRYGRNPAVEPGIVSVPVRDETLSLSKTHFEVGGDARGAWVGDHHSTNGTVLVRDGGRHPLHAGVRTALRDGDLLELGDRIASVSVPR
ncbi:RDD family protein [Microbacterium flavescens]|uniref:RDD family protein n=1 Tax=Microbacterium flavescens TaxID=69366 RepID=UPI001BDDFBEF|nr:RDD family protein [Microbacterium flavescens]